MPRIYCPIPLEKSSVVELPAGAARHVQVLRMQPGDIVTLFSGEGGEWSATIDRMGRSNVSVVVGEHDPVEREAARRFHLALAVPANDRMDWLVEKATELGAASIQPLMTSHSVLRLKGERADKKIAHWEAVAVAACEQCGRNRVPMISPVKDLDDWLASLPQTPEADHSRILLSVSATSKSARDFSSTTLTFLSGPEGGLSASEEESARARGFEHLNLGPRVLRAETAPLAAIAMMSV